MLQDPSVCAFCTAIHMLLLHASQSLWYRQCHPLHRSASPASAGATIHQIIRLKPALWPFQLLCKRTSRHSMPQQPHDTSRTLPIHTRLSEVSAPLIEKASGMSVVAHVVLKRACTGCNVRHQSPTVSQRMGWGRGITAAMIPAILPI